MRAEIINKLLELAENVRDHLDGLDSELSLAAATYGIEMPGVNREALAISTEIDEICRLLTPGNEVQLDLLQEQTAH